MLLEYIIVLGLCPRHFYIKKERFVSKGLHIVSKSTALTKKNHEKHRRANHSRPISYLITVHYRTEIYFGNP